MHDALKAIPDRILQLAVAALTPEASPTAALSAAVRVRYLAWLILVDEALRNRMGKRF